MRFDRLDLNLLVALDTLLELGNVTSAARKLNLSQSAMSGALGRLREYFDDELLSPSGRSMVLTPKAIELAHPVREALLFIRSRITTPATFEPATSERSFSLASSDYAYHVLLADAFRSAALEAPNVEFEISPPGPSTFERLERGDIDLFITIDKYLPTQHPVMPLFSDEHAVICWSENPFCKNGVDAETFVRLRHVTASFGRDRSPAFAETLFQQMGILRGIAVRVATFAAIPHSVIGTNRIATMYRRHAHYFAQYLPIKVYPMPFEMPNICEAAQWHRMRDSDSGVRWLLGHIKRTADGLKQRP